MLTVDQDLAIGPLGVLAEEILGPNGSWRDDALCKDSKDNSGLFFLERGESGAPARDMCRQCTVRDECLEFALENREEIGIWGGLSARERMTVRAARKREAREAVSA